jgi:hypothetical protein
VLLAVQILYRRRFARARQQSRREYSADMQPQDTLGDFRAG